MLQHMLKKIARRRGLTLLELVVVMGILAALAGLLVPLMPNLIQRANTSTDATNLGSVSEAIGTFFGRHSPSIYPDQLDNLVVSSAIATYIPNGGSIPPGSAATAAAPLTTHQLSAADVTALNAVGIANVWNLTASNPDDYNWSPTFGCTLTPAAAVPEVPAGEDGTGGSAAVSAVTATPLAESTSVASLTSAAATRMGIPAGATYVVFGLGSNATICGGHGMSKAPIANSVVPGEDPNTVYCRFGLVFQTTDTSGNALTQAQFVGPVQFTGYGLWTKDDAIQSYYSTEQ
jgi:prepilin-type N-terminal cleavage/methylation domain-containing protein